MKKWVFLFLALMTVPGVRADDAPISGAEKPVPVHSFATLSVRADDGDKVSWRVFPAPVKRKAFGNELDISGLPGKTYTVWVTVRNSKTDKFDEGEVNLTFAGKAPDVDPDPIEPNSSAPIPEPGFRVLFVFDKLKLTEYPPGQLNAMDAGDVKAYLREKCVKGPDGKTPETRAYAADTPMENAPKLWQDVMARKRTELPWVVISNGKAGYEGPVPYNKANSADLTPILTLLKKYGG